MILPVSTYHHGYSAIVQGNCDVIYPYGCGAYQRAVNYPMEVYEGFLNSKFDSKINSQRCRQ